MKPSLIVALLLFAVVGFGGFNSIADDAGVELRSIDAQVQQCTSSEALMKGSQSEAESVGSGDDVTPSGPRHGPWHPCANDPNACGAGHSCCGGHCVAGSCT